MKNLLNLYGRAVKSRVYPLMAKLMIFALKQYLFPNNLKLT